MEEYFHPPKWLEIYRVLMAAAFTLAFVGLVCVSKELHFMKACEKLYPWA